MGADGKDGPLPGARRLSPRQGRRQSFPFQDKYRVNTLNGGAIKEFAGAYAGKVRVGKLNVDDNPSTTMKFMVRGIPTVILFKDGQVVDQIVGLVDKNSLSQMVNKHL